MTTEYERYQLEWMIAHGHGLKELMDELTLYQNELLLVSDENLTVREVFDEWVDGQGFERAGELFVCEQEWRVSEGRAITALEDGGALYDLEHSVLIANTDLLGDEFSVFEATPADLREITSRLDENDVEWVVPPLDPVNDNCELIGTFRSIADLREAGYLDSDLIDVSDIESLVDAVKRLTSSENVREWYMTTYPKDELGAKLNPDLTFDDVLAAVPKGNGIYDSIGVRDGTMRSLIFDELCRRYGYTIREVHDSWLNESPLPSPAISQDPEKIAVAAGYRFNLVDAQEASGIDLKACGTVVTVDGHDYEVMKGATYEDSRKVDDLLDSHGDKPISGFRKQGEQSLDELCAAKCDEAELFGDDAATERDEIGNEK